MYGYIFAADVYCKACGNAIRARLTRKGLAPAEPRNESTYDSDDFPKGPWDYTEVECDTPQHCASGPACLNAETIDGVKGGCWMENPLTASGVHYVIEALRDGGPVAEFWAAKYAEELAAEGVTL